MREGARGALVALVVVTMVAVLTACEAAGSGAADPQQAEGSATTPAPEGPTEDPGPTEEPGPTGDPGPTGTVTLAFAGDTHFELHLADLLRRPQDGLGPISRTLRRADLAMVNLESSITSRGEPEPKDYHFRTSPAALDVLDRSGVDVVTMANNHAVDYGRVGLEDTLRAVRRSPVPVVGIGRNQARAFRPHVATVKGTDVAFLAANSRRERTSAAWGAGQDSPGIAAAWRVYSRPLLAAVRSAAEQADVVVVYLHWGTELQQCPGAKQRMVARALAEAGADVIVGTHAHVLLGSGWLGETYVSYGLGNFVWYHNRIPNSGVVRVRIVDGQVVGDAFTPARIEPDGLPRPLTGAEGDAATAQWRAKRGCTGLAAGPPA